MAARTRTLNPRSKEQVCSTDRNGVLNRAVATDTNFSSDFDVWVRKSQSGLAADAYKRVFEAGGIAAREKLLRVSGISLSAELTGQGQLQIKQPIFAADVAMTAASWCNFSGIQSLHDSIRIGR